MKINVEYETNPNMINDFSDSSIFVTFHKNMYYVSLVIIEDFLINFTFQRFPQNIQTAVVEIPLRTIFTITPTQMNISYQIQSINNPLSFRTIVNNKYELKYFIVVLIKKVWKNWNRFCWRRYLNCRITNNFLSLLMRTTVSAKWI